MLTILVTGGSGLVGNAFKKISSNYEQFNFIFISSKDYDLSIFESTKNMFDKYKPDYVIHLAAYVGGLYKNMNFKVDMLEKNLMINYNVIKLAHEFKVKKLIACLSTCIFPNILFYPITESALHNGPPHHSNDAYAYAKRMLEIHCKAYRENYGDNFICVTPTNIYGLNDNFDLENAHVLPALIHKCYLAKQENKDFIVRGTGKPLRQFIYSEDLATLMMLVLENYDKENIILSVPEHQEVSIGDVAKFIAEKFNYSDRIIFDNSYTDGQYKKTVCTSKLIDLINNKDSNFKFTNIKNGISKTVDWFVLNYDNNIRLKD
jgi:GDP-L-fucose synthase